VDKQQFALLKLRAAKMDRPRWLMMLSQAVRLSGSPCYIGGERVRWELWLLRMKRLPNDIPTTVVADAAEAAMVPGQIEPYPAFAAHAAWLWSQGQVTTLRLAGLYERYGVPVPVNGEWCRDYGSWLRGLAAKPEPRNRL